MRDIVFKTVSANQMAPTLRIPLTLILSYNQSENFLSDDGQNRVQYGVRPGVV